MDEKLRKHADLERLDLLYFSAPPTVAELFFPLDNVPILVQAPYNFELSRNLKTSIGGPTYLDSVSLFRAAAQCTQCRAPRFITTQSRYEEETFLYNLGIRLPRLPMHANYIKERYNPPPGSKQVLLTIGSRPHQAYAKWVATPTELFVSGSGKANSSGMGAWDIQHLESPFTWATVAGAKAIVYIPYKQATNFLLEIYRTTTPIFTPSPAFFTQLDLKYGLGAERVWCKGLPMTDLRFHTYHPINRTDLPSNEYWWSFADQYQYPHIVLFDSWQDLIEKLDKADFGAISTAMREFRAQLDDHLRNKWYDIIAAGADRDRSEHSPAAFDEQMERLFGMKLVDEVEDMAKEDCNTTCWEW